MAAIKRQQVYVSYCNDKLYPPPLPHNWNRIIIHIIQWIYESVQTSSPATGNVHTGENIPPCFESRGTGILYLLDKIQVIFTV